MSDESANPVEADEDILTHDVSDETLERAARLGLPTYADPLSLTLRPCC